MTRSMLALALVFGALCAPVPAQEGWGPKIRKAIEDLTPSMLKIHYTFEETRSRSSFILEDPRGGSADKKGEAICIGLVIDDQGTVLVSGHVFPDPHGRSGRFGGSIFGRATSPPKSFHAEAPDGERLEAELLSRDEELNLAFLKVKAPHADWRPVAFDTDTKLQIGDPFMLLKFLEPKYDYQRSFTIGRITGVIEGKPERLLQNAGGFSGRSGPQIKGGPVISLDTGKVVGILLEPKRAAPMETSTSGLSTAGARQAISVVIGPTRPEILPASALASVLANPLAAKSRKGWLGLERMQPLTSLLAKHLGRDEGQGVVISLIGDGSPAAKSGLRPEDLVIAIGDDAVDAKNEDAINDITRKIRRLAVGSTVAVKVIRGGKEESIPVKVAAMPRSAFEAATYADDVFGVTVAEITYDVIHRKNLDADDLGRVLIRKTPFGGFFSMAGLAVGDIVLGINEHHTTDIKAFKAACAAVKKDHAEEVLVKVKRGADTRFVKIKPDW